MATSKKRINVSLSKEVHVFLKKIALRDEVPEATKAAELLEKAMEIEEDAYFSKAAEEQEASSKRFVKHKDFWFRVLR